MRAGDTLILCIEPNVEYCACLVDMLGHAGHVEEAFKFIKKMPLEPNAAVWGPLLGVHNNIVLGEHVAQLFEIEPKNSGNHVLLSKIHSQASKWDDVTRVKTMRQGVEKTTSMQLD
jgi:pentatricopeptide repeat protein